MITSPRPRRTVKLSRPGVRPINRRIKRDYRLYALRLTGGKYYIGLTAYKDVMQRFSEHVAGKDARGAKWTSRYKPLSVMEVRELGRMTRARAEYLETLMTLEYIKKFGLKDVRGGELCAVSGPVALTRYTRVTKRKKYAQAAPVRIRVVRKKRKPAARLSRTTTLTPKAIETKKPR